jgi:cytoplasmic iron level regulating protein YaaA (DUF328/UPF0246 family)
VSRPAPVVLLPHSKGQATGGDGPPWSAGTGVLPDLDAARATVLGATARAMGRPRVKGPGPALGRLLGAQGATLAAAVEANRALASAPTRPAIERYSGVLYDELCYPSLRARDRRRVDDRVLIVNALLGVVAPRDPLPEHRLELSASLPRLGRLGTWWRPRLTEALAPRLAGAVVWDLLPNEHAAAWEPGAVAVARRFTVRFVDEQGRTMSHWNKLLKGALVRFLAESGADDPAALAPFRHPTGYRFDPGASDLGGVHAQVVFRVQP